MIHAPDKSDAWLLDRRRKPVEPSNSFCAFLYRQREPTEWDVEIRTQGASDFPSYELVHHGRLDLEPRESSLAAWP
jgi:hypothetical protein